MDERKKYLVVYSDGQQERAKELLFLKKEGKFFVFLNERTNREEMIHEDRVIRIEERENGKNNNRH